MSHQETLIARETLYEGRVVSLYRDEITLENGGAAIREVVHHNGGVVIFAMLDGDVLLVRQYRHCAGQELLEIPAGKLELGEDPAHCAVRELEEETGYRAATVRAIGKFYVSPGYCDEVLHFYEATNLTPSQQNLDEDEFVSVVRMPLADALAACTDGRIIDAKSALVISMMAQR